MTEKIDGMTATCPGCGSVLIHRVRLSNRMQCENCLFEGERSQFSLANMNKIERSEFRKVVPTDFDGIRKRPLIGDDQ